MKPSFPAGDVRLLPQLIGIMAFKINGQTISDEDIYEEFESIKDHYARLGEVVCCDRDEEFMTYAKDNVVNRALLEQESLSRHGEISDEAVATKLEQMQSDHGGELEFYEETGFDRDDEPKIRRRIRSGLMVDRILEDVLRDETDPSDADLRSYYEANIDQFMSEERVRVSQIFMEPASHEVAKEAYQNLRRVRTNLLDGADFDEMAAKHGNNEKSEVDLGFLRQGESMPEIESIIFSMNIGEISPVVATHFGFHIFKAMEHEAPAPIAMEKLEGLQEQFIAGQRESKINAFIEDLKEKGSVEEFTVEED